MTNQNNEQPVSFIQLTIEDHPGKFALVRCEGSYATHWMDPYGVWIALPESDDEMDSMFKYLTGEGLLPVWDTSPFPGEEIVD